MSFDTCVFVHLDWASQMALVIKNPPANAGDLSANSISGSGRFPGKGNGNLLQYFCLESSIRLRGWWATVHRVTKCWTRLKRLHLHFLSPIMKRTSLWVLVLECLVDLHWTIQLQLLQHYWSGHRLGLLWYWMVYLGNEQRSFCHFWDCTQGLHFVFFCWLWGLLHFLPTLVDIMVMWIKFTHSGSF